MHKKEIAKLQGKMAQKGYTLIPLKIYFKEGRAKVEVGLAKGKREFEKRDAIKEREANREIDKAMKSKNR
jgi:SsrA-binding protein